MIYSRCVTLYLIYSWRRIIFYLNTFLWLIICHVNFVEGVWRYTFSVVMKLCSTQHKIFDFVQCAYVESIDNLFFIHKELNVGLVNEFCSQVQVCDQVPFWVKNLILEKVYIRFSNWKLSTNKHFSFFFKSGWNALSRM